MNEWTRDVSIRVSCSFLASYLRNTFKDLDHWQSWNRENQGDKDNCKKEEEARLSLVGQGSRFAMITQKKNIFWSVVSLTLVRGERLHCGTFTIRELGLAAWKIKSLCAGHHISVGWVLFLFFVLLWNSFDMELGLINKVQSRHCLLRLMFE